MQMCVWELPIQPLIHIFIHSLSPPPLSPYQLFRPHPPLSPRPPFIHQHIILGHLYCNCMSVSSPSNHKSTSTLLCSPFISHPLFIGLYPPFSSHSPFVSHPRLSPHSPIIYKPPFICNPPSQSSSTLKTHFTFQSSSTLKCPFKFQSSSSL